MLVNWKKKSEIWFISTHWQKCNWVRCPSSSDFAALLPRKPDSPATAVFYSPSSHRLIIDLNTSSPFQPKNSPFTAWSCLPSSPLRLLRLPDNWPQYPPFHLSFAKNFQTLPQTFLTNVYIYMTEYFVPIPIISCFVFDELSFIGQNFCQRIMFLFNRNINIRRLAISSMERQREVAMSEGS